MIKTLIARVAFALRVVFNRFEASTQRWGERSLIGQSLQSARFDIDAMTRMELQRRHRYWVCNSPLVQRIRNLFIQFSVGVKGLEVVPDSSDSDWNGVRSENWLTWCRKPELDNRLPMFQVCIQWAGALFDDGEIFIIKTQDSQGQPRTQTIEAHRVCTPRDMRDEEGKSIIDGIKVDNKGRPVYYCVRDDPMPGYQFSMEESFRRIPAENMIHIFKARRPGQMRGIPEGFSCMNTLNDYEDLHLMEMQVAKLASSIGNVETNPTGELDTAATRRLKLNIASQNQAGSVVSKSTEQFYKVTLGAQTVALKAGDSLKQFQVDRPSIATQQYWDLKMTEICNGYNVPKLLVVPYSLQGTVTRADLDICASAFRANFELVAWAMQQIYEWQTTWAVEFDRTMDGNPPSDFLECIIRPPRAPNVDIGYTAKALQLELQMGVKTLQDVYAEKQEDWRIQLRQIAEAEKYINELATEYGIEPERIAQKAAQQAAKTQSGTSEGEGDSPEAVGINHV